MQYYIHIYVIIDERLTKTITKIFFYRKLKKPSDRMITIYLKRHFSKNPVSSKTLFRLYIN